MLRCKQMFFPYQKSVKVAVKFQNSVEEERKKFGRGEGNSPVPLSSYASASHSSFGVLWKIIQNSNGCLTIQAACNTHLRARNLVKQSQPFFGGSSRQLVDFSLFYDVIRIALGEACSLQKVRHILFRRSFPVQSILILFGGNGSAQFHFISFNGNPAVRIIEDNFRICSVNPVPSSLVQ